MSGPYQDAQVTEISSSTKSGSEPVKLGWFQRWFLKHSRQAWQHSNQDRDMNIYTTTPRVTGGRDLNTRNSIDLSLIRADGGWIVQFTSYDDPHDRTHVHHYIIPDSEDFGPKLAEIVTLQCLR
jgi:hypothetical protein